MALFALAGASEKFEPDAHAEFDDLFTPGGAPARHDPEERAAIIAQLSAG